MAAAAAVPMAAAAAEDVEEALGLFTGIGLSEAKARETLRNGALSALLRQAVLQVRPPRDPTPGPPVTAPVPGAAESLPGPRLLPGHPTSPRPRLGPWFCPAPGPPVRRGSAPGRP